MIGSGGWTFGCHSGHSNHRLRIESIDQSQGYEPCGLNLDRLLRRESTPPRYTTTNRALTGFKVFNCNLRRVVENLPLAEMGWKSFYASNQAWSNVDELWAEERR